MGVTYKLKQEIIDFLINEKKTNPQLGCRNLVNIVEQKFQVKLSKSSVNSVIKEAQLSSSVGRKPLFVDKKQSKFRIPDDKKSQLFPPKALSDTIVPKEESLAIKSSISKKDKGVLHDGMGCFFLKAAEWDLSRNSLLGKILAKYVSSPTSFDVDLMSELLLFLPLFGIERPEDIDKYSGSGLWKMTGLIEPLEPYKVIEFIENIKDLKGLSLKMSNEIPQIFYEGKYIKIFLEDKSEFTFDSQYTAVLENNVQYVLTPIEKAVFDITRKIITNVQSVVMYNFQGSAEFSIAFYNMIAAFENTHGKKIKKAILFDENDREIAEFTTIPFKKRFFMAGCQSSQKEIQSIVKEKLCFNRFFNDFTKKDVEFCEQELVLRKPELLPDGGILLRAVFFQEAGFKDATPLVVITNIPKEEKSSVEVLLEFFKRWPGFLEKERISLGDLDKSFYENTKIGAHFYEDALNEKGKSFLIGLSPNICENVDVLLSALNKYCERHFFPSQYAQQDFASIKSRFYQLPGYLLKDDSHLNVYLNLSSHYPYREDLDFAIKKLNNREIFDPAGLRVSIFIE